MQRRNRLLCGEWLISCSNTSPVRRRPTTAFAFASEPSRRRSHQVAQLNHMLTSALRTPPPDPSDSEGVLLALETAKALETRGDTYEATRWLRRAATEAEKQGNDARVLVFAHAAADLTSTVREVPAAAPLPPARRSEPSEPSEPTIRVADLFDPAGPRSVSREDPIAQSPGPTSSPSISFVCRLSVSADQPLTERSVRVGATRVAVRRATGNPKSFSVERLDSGQPLPAGTTEAMLIFAEDFDGSPGADTDDSRAGERAAPTGRPG